MKKQAGYQKGTGLFPAEVKLFIRHDAKCITSITNHDCYRHLHTDAIIVIFLYRHPLQCNTYLQHFISNPLLILF